MALTLAQYASYLDTRDLTWPAPPEIERPLVKPHLVRLPDIKAVTWSVHGTLLAVSGGELYFEHPHPFIMQVALDKTIQEFKMWGAMTRKPGQPADYLRLVYADLLAGQRNDVTRREPHPEILAERVWEALVKRLLQKGYHFDTGFYGALDEFSKKVAYFFHSSLQGTACYPGAAAALQALAARGVTQGLIADGQCFTIVHLQRGLRGQLPALDPDAVLDPALRAWSCEVGARKPSERLFRPVLAGLAKRGLSPDQVLHVGASIPLDVIPARRLGLRTGLFAGDRAALSATNAQLRLPASRPDLLITDLHQVADALG
jgi:FMN phosphatase YigB (HAD superfamily)